MKIVTVVGARPQFIKAAAVSRVLRQSIIEILVHTGQHYDYNMSESFFKELEIPKPDYALNVGPLSPVVQISRIIESLSPVLTKEKPDWVLVYGDTNSTLAGAITASKHQIPLAHVEAGLRSFNKTMPEELNRVLTDHASDLLFAPTSLACENLMREGISKERIHNVGDVMYDAFFYYNFYYKSYTSIPDRLKLTSYVLVTIHRAENTDNLKRLTSIIEALEQLSEPIIFPLHPRTKEALKTINYTPSTHVKLIDPVSYLEMLALEKNAKLVITDSGGIQKEAFFCRVPCVILRDETEWQELLTSGWSCLASPSKPILPVIEYALNGELPPYPNCDLYGFGQAAEKIKTILMQ